MKLKKILVAVLILASMSILVACDNTLGGISIPSSDIAIGGYVWNTRGLRMTKGEQKEDYNYCIEISGFVKPVSNEIWDKYFKDETEDIKGKLIVVLKLDMPKDITNYSEISITASTPATNSENKNIPINVLDSKKSSTKFLLLNPHHDQIDITLQYPSSNITKQIKYKIDLMDVNSELQSENQ